MMTRAVRIILFLLIVSSVLVLPGSDRSTFASTFRTLDLGELASRSETVVRAVVLDKVSYWNRERSMIFTDVTLLVKQALGGSPPERMTIRVPGGNVDGFSAVMIGAAQFESGEEVVVFTGRWKDGAARVSGYEQGVSRVRRDAGGNLVLEGGAAHGLHVPDLVKRLAGSRSPVKQ